MTIKIGNAVVHTNAPQFGAGVVTEVSTDGSLRIKFCNVGEKKIAADFVQYLRPVDATEFPEIGKGVLPGLQHFNKRESYYRKYWDGYWEDSFHLSLCDRNKADASVIKEWYDTYHNVPEGILFDEDDLKLATGPQHKAGNHIHEWFAAISLYKKTGYLSLVEKYESPKAHSRKHEIFKKLAGDDFARFAAGDRPAIGYGECKKRDERQCPDLLMYAPDFSDWFFCEVKAGESIGGSQDNFFPIVKKMTNKPIYLMVLNR